MQKEVKAALIIISLMIVGYSSIGMLLPFPYGLAGILVVLGIGIFFLLMLAGKKFKFQQNS